LENLKIELIKLRFIISYDRTYFFYVKLWIMNCRLSNRNKKGRD